MCDADNPCPGNNHKKTTALFWEAGGLTRSKRPVLESSSHRLFFHPGEDVRGRKGPGGHARLSPWSVRGWGIVLRLGTPPACSPAASPPGSLSPLPPRLGPPPAFGTSPAGPVPIPGPGGTTHPWRQTGRGTPTSQQPLPPGPAALTCSGAGCPAGSCAGPAGRPRPRSRPPPPPRRCLFPARGGQRGPGGLSPWRRPGCSCPCPRRRCPPCHSPPAFIAAPHMLLSVGGGGVTRRTQPGLPGAGGPASSSSFHHCQLEFIFLGESGVFLVCFFFK